MNAARRNARRLAEDAKLLLEAGRYPTATALAVLSIEESGKMSILRGFCVHPGYRAAASVARVQPVSSKEECDVDIA